MSEITTVGDKVKLKKGNVVGLVRFIGEIKGKPGIFYGVELDEKHKKKGQNDGSVGKISYFKCKGRAGLFVKKAQIIKTNIKNNKNVPRVTVGDKVQCVKQKCKGTIKFIGIPYSLKKSDIHYGIELEKRKGTNNGSVKDRYYFKCKNKYGIFLQAESFITHQQKLIKTTGKATVSKDSKDSKHSKKKKAKSEEKKDEDEKEKEKEIRETKEDYDTSAYKKKTNKEERVNVSEMNETKDFDDDVEEKNLINMMENGLKRLKELLIAKDVEIEKLSQSQTDNTDTQMEINQLKELLNMKENEILNQKKMYQELERKNQELMEMIKSAVNDDNDGDVKDENSKTEENMVEEDVKDEKDEESEVSNVEEVETENIINMIDESKPVEVVDRHIECLVSGYIRRVQNSLNDNDNVLVILDEIVHVCTLFYFIGQIFTNIHSKYAQILENGTRIKSLGVGNVDICYPSDDGYRDGIHIWRLQCNECIDCASERAVDNGCVGHAIGVATDFINCCDCSIHELENSIYYDGNEGIIMDCVNKQTVDKKSKWSKGDVIMIMLDCDKGNITFYKNEENVGTYNLCKQRTYYLIVQLNSATGYDYKLTQYF